MKVLVVDDSALIRRLIRNTLGGAGFEDVIEAGSAEEAVDAARDQNPDLILLDWRMPQATGLDAAHAIRASGNRVPIVLLVTELEMLRIASMSPPDVDDYLPKPFTPEALIASVRKFARE